MQVTEKPDKLLASINPFMRLLTQSSYEELKRTMGTLMERASNNEYDHVQRTILARLAELIRMHIVKPSVFKKLGD